MAPPPLATAAAAAEEFLEVRCAGCEETLEVERGLTEFVCPDCGTAQSLPPELMPRPRRRALPLPRGAAGARGARLPCGACGELLSVPVGLSRCACPLCGAQLAVDSARVRDYILSSAEAAVVPLAAASVPPIVAAREKWQERPSYAMRAGLPRAEPDEQQGYTDHMIDGEQIHMANENVANNSLQRNRLPLGRRIVGNKERQALPLNEVRDHVNDQHPSYTMQPKRAQLARLHRVTHSEEIQDGLLSHEVYGEARHTELIDEATATHRNQRVGCSVSPQTVSIGERHMKTPAQSIQQVHKQPFHESHAEGSQLYCLDLDGVVHPPINQAKHGEEASTEMINKTLSRESIRPTGCAVEPNSVNVEKRKASTTNQAIREHISPATNREAMWSLPIKETTASCSSKQKKSKLANAKTIGKKRHLEPLNHIQQAANAKTIGKKRHIEPLNHIQQAEGQTSDSRSHGTHVDFESQSKANERPGNTSALKEREQVTPPNKLADLKQKNVRTNDETQNEQIEVNVSKQTSGWSWTQKKNKKGSIASSNAGLQLRHSKRLAKDSAAAIENEPLESDPGDLQDFGPNVQVPADAMDDESIEWEPLQQCPASPDCEVSVARTDTESVESENDEQYAVSPDESLSDSDYPYSYRMSAGLYPSTPSAHKLPQENSDELDDLDLTTTPSNTDMSDPEHFARNYCRLLPLEVRRALAKKKYNVFHDRLTPEGSNKVSLHDITDSEEQQQGKKGHKAGGNLCVKMWTLPEGVRVPVSLNTLGLPIGENANMLIYFLGALARDGILAPLTYISWKNIPKENKDVMWHIVKLKFDIDPPHELSVLRSIRNKWRIWKSYLKRKHYDSHTTEEERLADRDPHVSKEQWRVLVAYWNTEKAKARSAASKASRAKSTYVDKIGSKSFTRMHQEESRSSDPSLENPEGSGDDYAPAMGAKRRASARTYTPGPSTKDLQERSDPQAARAKRKAGDEVSTPRKKVVVTEESRPKNSQENAVLEAARAKRKAEDEAAALRKKVIVMEGSQKKLQEDLARVTNAMSAMQKMMSTGGLPNGIMGEPVMPPSFQQEPNEASSDDVLEPHIVYSGLRHPSSHNQRTQRDGMARMWLLNRDIDSKHRAAICYECKLEPLVTCTPKEHCRIHPGWTDHSQPGGILIMASRQGDVHREPCHHY
ncbi:unnamed protein product [Triticum aestivum]|uniref:Uncharacterized protein n=2 Tax=Triticum aestivum TaxID=4565 RepID=A0A7H4LM20_WHEAT|nr:unnamed protein product [Triticum aestivum]